MEIVVVALCNINGPVPRNAGEIFAIKDWDGVWQGSTPKSRAKNGFVIECYGMGEFMKFKFGQNVEKVTYD